MGNELKDQDFGLKVLRQGENDSIDIVAVSGLGAHPDRTWTMRNSEERWVNWLADADMLPKRLPNARIMRFGYRSEWFGPKEVETKKTLVRDVAMLLLKSLEHCREDPRRPLLFVAHSFGGHVVICALRKSFDNPDQWTNPFDSTAGLVFLGTPFRGRQGVSLSDMIKTIRKAHPDHQIWQETMQFSIPSNPFLLEIVDQFMTARVKRSVIPISCFYEDLPSPIWKTLRANDPEKETEKVYVVPQESACLDISPGIEEHCVLDRNHYNLNKFCEAKDVNYLCLADKTEKMAKGATDFLGKNYSRAQRIFKTNFSLVGFAGVVKFVDRPDEMKALEDVLLPGQGPRRKVFVLHGLGGIGKTQLSVEFARQFQRMFTSVIWLNAETKENVEQSITTFARRIPAGQISDASRLKREQRNIGTIMSEVRDWLSQPENTDWLAIVDSLDDANTLDWIDDFISDYISDADHGSILFTTRLKTLSRLGSSLELGKMNPCQAKAILESLLQRKCDLIQCDELLNRLDGLPLAIAQAGAFLKESGMKFEEYIECYDQKFKDLMEDKLGDKPMEYHGSVWTTWTVSFNSIKSKDETGENAANLLILCSCLDNKNLRRQLFIGASFDPTLPSWTRDFAENDQLKFSHAMQLLRRYSMVEEVEERGNYSIHPVVHEWIYHYRYDEIRNTMGRTATILLWKSFDHSLRYYLMEAENRIIPHIKRRVQKISKEEETQVRDLRARDVEYEAAKEGLRGRCGISEELDEIRKGFEEKFRRLDESGRSYDHYTLTTAESLFSTYLYSGMMGDAVKLGERVVKKFEEAADSGSKLTAMQILAEFYLYQGNISKAKSIIATVQQEYESKSLPIGLLKLDLMFAKTVLLLYEDKATDAVATMESVQEQTKKELGLEHELSILAICRLGILYSCLGWLSEIRKLLEQVEEMLTESAPKLIEGLRKILEVHGISANDRYLPSDPPIRIRSKQDMHGAAMWFLKGGRFSKYGDSPGDAMDRIKKGSLVLIPRYPRYI